MTVPKTQITASYGLEKITVTLVFKTFTLSTNLMRKCMTGPKFPECLGMILECKSWANRFEI